MNENASRIVAARPTDMEPSISVMVRAFAADPQANRQDTRTYLPDHIAGPRRSEADKARIKESAVSGLPRLRAFPLRFPIAFARPVFGVRDEEA